MSDLDDQLKTAVPDNNSGIMTDFGQKEDSIENALIFDETLPKKEHLERSKTQGLEVSEEGSLAEVLVTSKDPQVLPALSQMEVRDIKSDPELIGFWLQGRTLRTVEAYRLELKRFFKFTGGMRLHDLRVETLLSYADELKSTLSHNSQALAQAAVNRF